jgi:hypothetical protein
MDQEFEAYAAGRADGLAAHRDADRAADPKYGRDYRIGFLDGRLEVFRMLSSVRKIVEDD